MSEKVITFDVLEENDDQEELSIHPSRHYQPGQPRAHNGMASQNSDLEEMSDLQRRKIEGTLSLHGDTVRFQVDVAGTTAASGCQPLTGKPQPSSRYHLL